MHNNNTLIIFLLILIFGLIIFLVNTIRQDLKRNSSENNVQNQKGASPVNNSSNDIKPTTPTDSASRIVRIESHSSSSNNENLRGGGDSYLCETPKNDKELTSREQEETKCSAKPTSKIVINSKTEYKPEIVDEAFEFQGKTINPQHDARRYLIFTKEANEVLCDSIGWGGRGQGARTGKNRVEQGGVLIGRVFQFKQEIYNCVEYIILADTKGSPTFVEFTNAMWAEMQEKLSKINEDLKQDEQVFITGWFHTHPNMSVFMSGTDMNTQRLNFGQDWQVSLVLNPQGENKRAFFGIESTEGRIFKGDIRQKGDRYELS